MPPIDSNFRLAVVFRLASVNAIVKSDKRRNSTKRFQITSQVLVSHHAAFVRKQRALFPSAKVFQENCTKQPPVKKNFLDIFNASQTPICIVFIY